MKTLAEEITPNHSKLLKDMGEANYLGEAIRSHVFPGEGYGCYENFEVADWLHSTKERKIPLDIATLLLGSFAKDEDELASVCSYRGVWYYRGKLNKPLILDVYYYWDGDGVLLFKITHPPGVNKEEPIILYNSDCKKDYEWQLNPTWHLDVLDDDSYYE